MGVKCRRFSTAVEEFVCVFRVFLWGKKKSLADDDGGDGLLWLFAEVDHKNALKKGEKEEEEEVRELFHGTNGFSG